MSSQSANYDVHFALMTIAGNITRYNTMKPFVEADPEVTAEWSPIRTWVEKDWVHVLPGMSRVWARHLLDSRRAVLGRSPDAYIVHAFETYGLIAIRKKLLRSSAVLVCNPDAVEPSRLIPVAFAQTDLFVPWSQDCRREFETHSALVTNDNTRVLHPGIDLAEWTFSPTPPSAAARESGSGEKFRLLFIGGDFARKGGPALLDAFEQGLSDSCHLTVVTREPLLTPDELRRLRSLPGVDLRLDVVPGSGESKRFYAEADALVLPTHSEGLPWVLIEALAIGLPVVSTLVNGIPDIVTDGETGLAIDVDDPAGIVDAVDRLRTRPDLRDRLVERGRRRVEEHYDAARNTAQLMTWTKELVDDRRGGLQRST